MSESTSPPPPPKRHSAVRQVVVTLFARLRFVAILGAIGFVIVKWDVLTAHYEKWTRGPGGGDHAASDVEYFCPMHPQIVRDTNKDKCPICFMPLSKRKKGEGADIPLPPGVVARVQLSPYRVVLAGVKTAPVTYLPLSKELTTVGTVEFDERGLKHVAARVKGRIEKLSVNQTGQMVHKGNELATVYSPDLVVTVQNLLDARRSGNKELEAIARDRLVLWGIEPDQVEQIVKTGKPSTQVTVRSPIDGHVIRKYQTEGRYVDEGTPLYDVADLSSVWIQAQVYEEDLSFLPPESHEVKPEDRLPVTATTRAYPGETFSGNLSFVYPHVDQETRTLTVRFELKNSDGRLKPGMTATVRLSLPADKLARFGATTRLKLDGGKVMAVPEGSVIDTGAVKLVYREESPGVFEGVKVELGPRMADAQGVTFFPVLSGLSPGQAVVTTGSFLVDAETRLNPAAGSIYVGGSSGGGGKPASTVRPSTPEDAERTVRENLSKLPPEDRVLAEAQKECPVLPGSALGSMGKPVKVTVNGKTVFLCCPGCNESATAEPEKVLAKAEGLKAGKHGPADANEAKIRAELAKLPAADRMKAERQRLCPVSDERLGSMGVPVKLAVSGSDVFVCCKGCTKSVEKKPVEMLQKVSLFNDGKFPKK
ncbi:MAG: efflux RND transporter periplasmic adaptor subunit [Gemmataceae bacterium]|nr:efflux RND transporter periplasmic adaptor subunit [Gemmataceae bacterium]